VSVKKGDARSGWEQTERNKKEEEKRKNDGIKLTEWKKWNQNLITVSNFADLYN